MSAYSYKVHAEWLPHHPGYSTCGIVGPKRALPAPFAQSPAEITCVTCRRQAGLSVQPDTPPRRRWWSVFRTKADA